MKREMRDFGHVFGFTFAQHWKGKSFLRATVTVAVLCLLLPAVILPAVVLWSGSGHEATPDAVRSELAQVYIVDRTSTPEADTELWRTLTAAQEGFSSVTYHSFGADAAAAVAAAEKDGGHSLILYLDENDSGVCTLRVLLPENSMLGKVDAQAYERVIGEIFPQILGEKLGVEPARLAEMSAAVEIAPHVGTVAPEAEVPDDANPNGQDETREILSMLLPYLNIMILYFMVLFYGQSVANSVILEKTSKLVDTFLVAVRPGAMILGKLLATALSGALQLVLWLVSLLGGFAVGGALVRMISPGATVGLLLATEGMFTLPGLLLSVLILMGGFLLYCSLAAIGGAMASKPEELSSTNSLFSMILITSFFCTLYAGGMGAGMSSSAAWLSWVPFTAILVAPSRILMGELSLVGAVGVLALVLLTAFLLVLLAGRIYRMLILYKGKVPKLGEVLKMLLSRS